ncbi:MAG: SurA N-terminal domain-containing protein, partial [Bacteroidetes bacterium]|nr:SurA N-terminal domain-containing protein [Bacteroidota bacterium]
MAIIQTIRKRSGLLIALIAVAIISFLLMDTTNSNPSSLAGQTNIVGEIDGRDITYQEFQIKYNEVLETHKIANNVTNVDEATQLSLREQAWQQFIQDFVFGAQYGMLGVTVSSEELYDIVQGDNPHPEVVKSFTNPQTGLFDKGALLNFLQTMNDDPDGESLARWLP